MTRKMLNEDNVSLIMGLIRKSLSVKDGIDDTAERTDAVYSSHKVLELLKDYYTKDEIDIQKSSLAYEIVSELPTENIEENKFYFVKVDSVNNIYSLNLWDGSKWIKLGSTEIEEETIIDDTAISEETTWSSQKIKDYADCTDVNIQTKKLDTPSLANYGQIKQYIGATAGSYVNGAFYKCVQDSDGNYLWQMIIGVGTTHISCKFKVSGAVFDEILIVGESIAVGTETGTLKLDKYGNGEVIVTGKEGTKVIFTGKNTGYSDFSIIEPDVAEKEVSLYPDRTLYWYGNNVETIGDKCEESEWTNSDSSMTDYTKRFAELHEDHLSLSLDGNANAYVLSGTKSKFDLSEYDELHIVYKSNTTDGKIILTTDSDIFANKVTEFDLEDTSNVEKESVFDISNITDESYITTFLSDATSGVNKEVEIYKIWVCSPNALTCRYEVNGAVNDIIKITGHGVKTALADNKITLDSNGVGVVDVKGLKNEIITFTSEMTEYKKTVTMDNISDSVNVYPSGAMYWYGREFVTIKSTNYVSNEGSPLYPSHVAPTVINENGVLKLTTSYNNTATLGSVYLYDNNIIKDNTKIKCIGYCYNSSNSTVWQAIRFAKTFSDKWEYDLSINLPTNNIYELTTIDISSIPKNDYIVFEVGTHVNAPTTIYLKAIWFESTYDFTIKGAPNDTVIISGTDITTNCEDNKVILDGNGNGTVTIEGKRGTAVNFTSVKFGTVITEALLNIDNTISFGVYLNLTVSGATGDDITITNEDGDIIGNVSFETDKTEGTIELLIPSAGVNYTFTSSIAKDTKNGTSAYSKVVTLNSATTRVNVYPDGSLYWYGNEITDRTGGFVKNTKFNGAYSKEANRLYLTGQTTSEDNYSNESGIVSSNNISTEGCTKLGASVMLLKTQLDYSHSRIEIGIDNNGINFENGYYEGHAGENTKSNCGYNNRVNHKTKIPSKVNVKAFMQTRFAGGYVYAMWLE